MKREGVLTTTTAHWKRKGVVDWLGNYKFRHPTRERKTPGSILRPGGIFQQIALFNLVAFPQNSLVHHGSKVVPVCHVIASHCHIVPWFWALLLFQYLWNFVFRSDIQHKKGRPGSGQQGAIPVHRIWFLHDTWALHNVSMCLFHPLWLPLLKCQCGYVETKKEHPLLLCRQLVYMVKKALLSRTWFRAGKLGLISLVDWTQQLADMYL